MISNKEELIKKAYKLGFRAEKRGMSLVDIRAKAVEECQTVD